MTTDKAARLAAFEVLTASTFMGGSKPHVAKRVWEAYAALLDELEAAQGAEKRLFLECETYRERQFDVQACCVDEKRILGQRAEFAEAKLQQAQTYAEEVDQALNEANGRTHRLAQAGAKLVTENIALRAAIVAWVAVQDEFAREDHIETARLVAAEEALRAIAAPPSEKPA